MADDQWQGVGLGRADVEKMDGLIVDLGRELGEGVQTCFLLPPIESGAPILGKTSQVVERHAAAPSAFWELIGPAGLGQTVVELFQGVVGNLDAKGADCAHRISYVEGHGFAPFTRL